MDLIDLTAKQIVVHIVLIVDYWQHPANCFEIVIPIGGDYLPNLRDSGKFIMKPSNHVVQRAKSLGIIHAVNYIFYKLESTVLLFVTSHYGREASVFRSGRKACFGLFIK